VGRLVRTLEQQSKSRTGQKNADIVYCCEYFQSEDGVRDNSDFPTPLASNSKPCLDQEVSSARGFMAPAYSYAVFNTGN
jgi:hypothetical protein